MSKFRSEVFLETWADVILQSDIGNARRPIAGRSGDQAAGTGVACEGRCAGTLSQAGLRGATGKASETVVTEGNTHTKDFMAFGCYVQMPYPSSRNCDTY